MSRSVPAAYGVRVDGLQDDRWLGVTGAGHWPRVTCVRDERPGAPDLACDLPAGVVRIAATVAHAEIVHPLLGRLAGQLSLGGGVDALHAGAAVGTTGAWVVIGPKRAGKSTLLAALASAGTAIVTDDVLVLSDGRALAGPRCIDLRAGASHLAAGVPVRPGDPRHRIALPSIAAEHPLAGVIHLGWSDSTIAVHRLGHRDSISRLLAVQAEKGFPRRPGALLDLAALPALHLVRPRAMAQLDDTVSLIQDVLRGTASVSKNRPGRVVACV